MRRTILKAALVLLAALPAAAMSEVVVQHWSEDVLNRQCEYDDKGNVVGFHAHKLTIDGVERYRMGGNYVTKEKVLAFCRGYYPTYKRFWEKVGIKQKLNEESPKVEHV